MYQKEIIYMSLYKDGNRLGNAGFLKVEKRGRDGKLSLTVKNAPRVINGRYPVRYYSGADWKEVDGIVVREGGGLWEKKEEDSLEQVRLQILLPGGYSIEGTGRSMETKVKKEPGNQDGQGSQNDQDVLSGQDSQDSRYSSETMKNNRPQEIVTIPDMAAVQERPASQPVTPGRPPLMADALAIEGLKEDKWEQILDTYDRIHPYDDARVYVKIAPKDFIILSSGCQHLVNNSFLLHGFYNYRYVILGKEGEDYCLGVPGAFYEREKMVALMFGFEAFECEGGDPKPGDFGYYLRKVTL